MSIYYIWSLFGYSFPFLRDLYVALWAPNCKTHPISSSQPPFPSFLPLLPPTSSHKPIEFLIISHYDISNFFTILQMNFCNSFLTKLFSKVFFPLRNNELKIAEIIEEHHWGGYTARNLIYRRLWWFRKLTCWLKKIL